MKRDVAIHRRIETRLPAPLRAREFSLVNMTAFAPKNVKQFRSNVSPIQGVGCTARFRVSDTRCGTYVI